MAWLTSEFKRLLKLRRPAPPEGPNRGCPPQCADPYIAAVKSTYSPALQNIEEELKQTSAARKLIRYAIQDHLANQHSQTRGDRLAA